MPDAIETSFYRCAREMGRERKTTFVNRKRLDLCPTA